MDLTNLSLEELFNLLPKEISRETVNGYENKRPQLYKKTFKDGMNYCLSCYYYGYENEEKKNCGSRHIFARDKNIKNAVIKFLSELKRITKFNDHLIYKKFN